MRSKWDLKTSKDLKDGIPSPPSGLSYSPITSLCALDLSYTLHNLSIRLSLHFNMRTSSRAALAILAATAVTASTLADVCTVANIQATLPANGTLQGINLNPSSVTANAVHNATSHTSSTAFIYCNVTVQYEHTGHNIVMVWYNFPSPDDFKNRFYIGGGGGFTISTTPTSGLAYSAGSSDAGYDGYTYNYDEVVLYGNGSINCDATYMVCTVVHPLTIEAKNSIRLPSFRKNCHDWKGEPQNF